MVLHDTTAVQQFFGDACCMDRDKMYLLIIVLHVSIIDGLTHAMPLLDAGGPQQRSCWAGRAGAAAAAAGRSAKRRLRWRSLR